MTPKKTSSKRRPTVLVTGLGGFAGSHFLDHALTTTDWNVIGLASFRSRGVPERITDSVHYQAHRDRVQIFTHDLTSPISHILKKRIGKVDYIVNYASDSHVDRSIENPVPFVENNVSLILNILEFAREAKPKAFLQIGTDEEFGAADDDYRHAEWDPSIPSNPYSASKAAQSSVAISYWRTFDVPVILTQTMNLIGERQDTEKFVPMTIKRIAAGQSMTIHGKKGQIGSRFYLHARNQADAVLFILKNHPPATYPDADRPDRYNIVGELEVDNLTMAKKIAAAVGKPLKYELVDFHAARPGHDRRYALDGTKLAKLGWKPPLTFDESLERTVTWTLANPQWLR